MGRDIFHHRSSRTYHRPITEACPRRRHPANAYEHARADGHLSRKMGPRCHMDKIPQKTIMIYRGAGVNNDVIANHSVGLNDCASKDHDAIA